MNTAILGTDSLDEILAHEAEHRTQALAEIQRTGECPDYSNLFRLLNDEVDAYCVSDVLRVQRTRDVWEANNSTLARLLTQFFGRITVQDLLIAWQRGCPRFAFPPTQ